MSNDVTDTVTLAVNGLSKLPILLKTNLQWAKENRLTEHHHVQNEDKIDESYKSQLKFEYEIYLLNYTIKIKT